MDPPVGLVDVPIILAVRKAVNAANDQILLTVAAHIDENAAAARSTPHPQVWGSRGAERGSAPRKSAVFIRKRRLAAGGSPNLLRAKSNGKRSCHKNDQNSDSGSSRLSPLRSSKCRCGSSALSIRALVPTVPIRSPCETRCPTSTVSNAARLAYST